MSNKIPIGSVVGKSFSFTFRNFFTLFRLGWLPIALAVFIPAYVTERFTPDIEGQIEPLTENIGMLIIGSLAVSVLAWAVFAVAVHRLVLNQGKAPTTWLYFRLTLQEIRYLIAPLFVYVIIGALLVLGIGLLFGADIFEAIRQAAQEMETSEQPAMPTELSGIQAGGLFILISVVIYISVRLILVLPIVVAENRIGIRRSWSLMEGNFWRMFFVSLLTIIIIVAGIIGITIGVGALYAVLLENGISIDMEDIQSLFNATPEMVDIVLAGLVNIAWIVLSTSLSLSILSYSYRSLAPVKKRRKRR